MSHRFRYRFQLILDYLARQKQEALERCRACRLSLEKAEAALKRGARRLEQGRLRWRQREEQQRECGRQLLQHRVGAALNSRQLQQHQGWLAALEADADRAARRAQMLTLALEKRRAAVSAARAQLLQAETQLQECHQREEIFNRHRARAEQLFQAALEYRDSLEQDEIGAILHQLQSR